ncbi:acyl-CoA thioester hydrolase/BAAT C-terminal domain-containing protein [Sphingomonas sp.]|uniref:acyl-CoA thioester hydrolase/BAAT C-terminal domain-containing protein n=1 Tax=Sphingomonas sp. TaxID=28214 RepID=UPI002ED94D72
MTIALALGAPIAAAPTALIAQTAPAPAGIAVRDNGLVATWYPPASGRRGPVILVLGGSEGGEEGSQRLGAALAGHGYGVLALAYFRAEGLPPQLQEIPLEYFGKAIDWLKAQPLADAARIGLHGISKGGEAALLLASHRSEIKAVVAAVPSSVVWQGINFTNYSEVKSSFSLAGKPMAYVPYDTSAAFTGVLDLYQRSLKLAERYPEAAIPVERIAGAVLLLSAAGDSLWPSTQMSARVMQRLEANHFRHPHRHIAYPDAGHGAMLPASVWNRNSSMDSMGGTEAGNAAAQADAWSETLAFFDKALGGPAR